MCKIGLQVKMPPVETNPSMIMPAVFTQIIISKIFDLTPGICNFRVSPLVTYTFNLTRMWANAQRDGRPAEYRWRPLFNAAKFG